MARRKVVEIICDRCGKTETQEPSQESKAEGAELVVEFQGRRNEYADLCLRCRKACDGYFKSLTKQLEKEESSSPAEEKKRIFGLGGKAAAG
jgi:hypothetical protein